MGHSRLLLGTDLLVYVALDLCYISWLKLDFQAISFAEKSLRTGKLHFCSIFATPKFSGLRNLRHIQVEGQHCGSSKNGLS
jgi:hypothetical protein